MHLSLKASLWPITAAAALFMLTGCRGHAQLPQKAALNIQDLFTPSGWMGDGEYGRKYIAFSGADRTQPHAQATSIKITYTFGPQRWGGFYWQNLPDNWGDKPGADYSGRDFSKVTFWARGETGNEVVEFKVGGIDNPAKQYRDSLVATLGRVTLTKDWQQYTIDLSGKNFSSVVGGFCWVASSDYNTASQITFYIEGITMQ